MKLVEAVATLVVVGLAPLRFPYLFPCEGLRLIVVAASKWWNRIQDAIRLVLTLLVHPTGTNAACQTQIAVVS